MAEIYKLTDKDGIQAYPKTITSAVYNETKSGKLLTTELSELLDKENTFNVTKLYPTLGLGATDQYDLQSAISLLDVKLEASQKAKGITVVFQGTLNGVQKFVAYRYISGTFTLPASWESISINNINVAVFNQVAVSPVEVGGITNNSERKGLEFKVSSTFNMLLGQQSCIYVKNGDVALTKGTAVYVDTALGSNFIVKKASNSDTSKSVRMIGILGQDLAVNGFGYVVQFGQIFNMNTSAWVEQTVLYLGSNGELTSTKPTAQNEVFITAMVLRQHATQGVIFVRLRDDYRSKINASSGIAGLDASGKLTEALLPYPYQKTSEKGQPNGYASLDGSGDVPDTQIPTNIERNTNKNIANGYAGLDSDGYVPISLIRSDLLERLYSYGVKYDVTISSPALTRTMNMDLHRSLPIQSKMRGCLLDDNGVVVEYIEDWSTAVKDGSKGQVMIEIPTHYVRFITDGNTREVRMSEIPIPGYKLINKHYISAYEASVNRTNSKLSSVINMSVDYRGGNNNATWDGTYRTLLGRPATALSRTNLRTYARNRNGAATSEWNLMVYSSYRDLFWLFALEYATLNSQLPFNPVKDANGFSQGGLGDGVTTLTSTQWNNYNSYYPFVPCGHSDSLGTGSGEVAYNMIDDLGSIVAIVMVNRYRGVEIPFGHIWKWADGINIDVKSDADGGTSKIYTCENTDKFNDAGYDYYDMIGLEDRSGGYIRKITFCESGDISTEEVGGGSTTYFCDYHYASVSSSSLRGVLFGGSADNGAYAGFVCSYSAYAPSNAIAYFGSRLCFIPQRTR